MDTPDSPIPSLDAFIQLFADAGKAYVKSFHEVAAAFAGPTAPPTDFKPTEDERTWANLKEALDEQERTIASQNLTIDQLGDTIAEDAATIQERDRLIQNLRNTVVDLKTTVGLQATEVQRLLTGGHRATLDRVREVLLDTLGKKKTDLLGLSSVTLAVSIQDDLKGFQDLTKSLRQTVEELRGQIRAARDTLHP